MVHYNPNLKNLTPTTRLAYAKFKSFAIRGLKKETIQEETVTCENETVKKPVFSRISSLVDKSSLSSSLRGSLTNLSIKETGESPNHELNNEIHQKLTEDGLMEKMGKKLIDFSPDASGNVQLEADKRSKSPSGSFENLEKNPRMSENLEKTPEKSEISETSDAKLIYSAKNSASLSIDKTPKNSGNRQKTPEKSGNLKIESPQKSCKKSPRRSPRKHQKTRVSPAKSEQKSLFEASSCAGNQVAACSETIISVSSLKHSPPPINKSVKQLLKQFSQGSFINRVDTHRWSYNGRKIGTLKMVHKMFVKWSKMVVKWCKTVSNMS